MKFNLKLDINDLSSFDEAIKQTREIEEYIRKKIDELISRLADIGVETAQRIASNGSSSGNTDVEIHKEATENGSFRIVMSGEDVYFIEFGAGIGVDESDPFVAQANVDVYDGSYSIEHNGPYIKYGSWFYNNVQMNGIAALKPMYYSQKEMENQLIQVAREVFNS